MEGGPEGKLENTECKRFYKHLEVMIQDGWKIRKINCL